MTENGENRQANIFLSIAYGAVLYIAVSLLAYWIRNPEKTYLQVWMNLADALAWQ